ncbi:MAG: hypothetical protein FE048_00280 [Thermoplasmata archaeon]|nr:MAG: hypothetical protein FE048_00280 [Thermoplasmata archaeon]
MKKRKVTSLFIFIVLFLSITFTFSEGEKRKERTVNEFMNDKDIDPLVDIHVFITIKRIREIECGKGNATFFVRTRINGNTNTSDVWQSVMDIEPNWSAIQDVPDVLTNVTICIELWKKVRGKEILCDINSGEGDENGKTLSLVYNLKRGEWYGDDYLGDKDGYGHANGAADGSLDGTDCEIWFTIKQNDYDDDGLTYWEEMNIYNTDPKQKDSGIDADLDGIPIEWEDYWGYDPFVPDEHSILDSDNDALSNIEEWKTAKWLSDPFYKDIFIEIDWMEGKNALTKPYKMPFLSKQYLFSIFSKHLISLHIDDGCMGGGEQIPYSNFSNPSIKEIYNKYFLHFGKNRWRKGIFHYAILCGVNPWQRDCGGFNFQEDGFVVCIGTIRAYRFLETSRIIATASLFMHEVGHNLGLFKSDFPGIDNQSCSFPWRKGWWIYANYKSCMNYRYAWHLIDYSDGSHGEIDYDDWGSLNFYHFKGDLF